MVSKPSPLNHDQIAARRELLAQEVREKRAQPETYPRMAFWLSFADNSRPEGQRFLGGCLIDDAVNFVDAWEQSHRLKANPGNCEVRGSGPIDPEDIPEGYPRNRFISKAEMESLGPLERMP